MILSMICARTLFALTTPGSKLVFYYRKGKNLSNIFSKNFKFFGLDNGIHGVYKISCNNCEKCYIGETGRPLSLRIAEHEKFKVPLSTYATFDHKFNNNHSLDYVNSRILFTESRIRYRKIIESMLIK